MPLYKTEQKLRKIPTREKLDMLIAKAVKPMSIKLTISKETGLRPVEPCNPTNRKRIPIRNRNGRLKTLQKKKVERASLPNFPFSVRAQILNLSLLL